MTENLFVNDNYPNEFFKKQELLTEENIENKTLQIKTLNLTGTLLLQYLIAIVPNFL